MSGRHGARGAWVALAALLVLAAGTVRAVLGAEADLDASVAAEARGDVPAAVAHARRAASAGVPGARSVDAAFARLEHLANLAEMRGDRDGAESAWRGLRSASFGARWLLAPREAERARADFALARLAGEKAAPAVAADLAREEALHPLARAAFVLGTSVSLAAIAWALFSGIDAEGRARTQELLRAGTLAALGLACAALAVLRG